MLTVTDAALQHLQLALTQTETTDSSCFRFTRQGEEAIGLRVQPPEADDQTFECDGETVLAAPEPIAALLSSKVLDIDDDGHLVLLPKAA